MFMVIDINENDDAHVKDDNDNLTQISNQLEDMVNVKLIQTLITRKFTSVCDLRYFCFPTPPLSPPLSYASYISTIHCLSNNNYDCSL